LEERRGVIGYDIDGTLTGREDLTGCVVISGRTFAEYDATCKALAALVPVYIRGAGAYGDRQHAGEFKALMISALGVTEYHEDDPVQADIIKARNPNCIIHLVG
jgi:hypothetical protein